MNRMRYTIALSGLLLVAGCGQVTTNDQGAALQADDPAIINFQLEFPQSEARVALIDDGTQAIRVRVRPVPKGNWQELMQYFGVWNNNLVAESVLSPSNPSTSLSLLPGSYRINAAQFEAIDPDDGSRIERAMTLVDLEPGSHNILLTLLHGSWDFVNSSGARANLDLQLLDNPDALDTDPASDGIQAFDWDPLTDGSQTPADLLGLEGSSLAGIHLYGGARLGRDSDFYSITQISSQPLQEVMGKVSLYPFLREPANGGDENVLDPRKNTWIEGGAYSTGATTLPGIHLAQYDSNNGNSSALTLGSWTTYAEGTSNENNYVAGIVFLNALPFDELPDFNAGSDDGSNIVYPIDETNLFYMTEQSFPTFENNVYCGNCGRLVVAYVNASEGSASHTNTEASIAGFTPTSVVDGSTIRGTLAEFIVTADATTPGGTVSDPGFDGSAPPDVLLQSKARQAAAINRAIQLDQLASKAGLKAQVANDFGSNCRTLSFDTLDYQTNFAWIDDAWVPGSYNSTYVMNSLTGVVSGSDWDNDSNVELWEQVYRNPLMEYVFTGGNYELVPDEARGFSIYQATAPGEGAYDLVDNATADQADIDDDGFIEFYEDNLVSEQTTSTVETCLHEFTLKGRQMSYQATTEVVVQ